MAASTVTDLTLMGAALALVAATLPMGLALAGPPESGRPALVIGPPWDGRLTEAIAAGGGSEIGPEVAPMARFAVLDRPEDSRSAGAWIIVDAGALLALCGFEGDI